MRNYHRANRKRASEELALVVFDQIGGEIWESVSDDLYDMNYDSVVDYMSQWDYGDYYEFVSESELYGDTVDMGHYVLNYSTSPAPHVALYAKAENHRASRKVAEYDPTNVFQNEGIWEIAEMVWDSRLLSYDVPDETVRETIKNYSEVFLGEVADTHFVDSVMNILKENLKHSSHRANRRASLKVSYSKEDEFEVHDEVVEKFPGGESALADLFGYTNLDQAEINSAKVMPYIEDAVFSRGGDQDDVDFAYDNLEYYFQTKY